MNLGIIILSRFNSKRFPGKALYMINNKALIDHLVDNFKLMLPNIKCVVATSVQKTDDVIMRHCKSKNIECFRGSLLNVSERVLKCALNYKWDYFVRINGDNLFNDPMILKTIFEEIDITDYDFISNVQGRTFPYGISVEIIKTSFYLSIFNKLITDNHKEHVTSWLYENEKYGKRYIVKNHRFKNLKGRKLSIDSKKDLDFANKIIEYNNGKNYVSLKVLDNFFMNKVDKINHE